MASSSVAGGHVQRLTARARAVRFPLAAPSWPTSVERPDPERKIGLDYDHEWSRRYPVRLARAVLMDNITRPVARLLAQFAAQQLPVLEPPPPPIADEATFYASLPGGIDALYRRYRG